MDFRQFENLGERIRKRLAAVNNDEGALSDIAAEVLTDIELDESFDFDEVSRFLVSTRIPQQPSLNFSDLPPVVYRCEHFRIEMLVWTEATTAIHQHAFSGAFRVFAGSSVHAMYHFDEEERVSSRLLIGTTTFQRAELLQSADVRPIRSGRSGLVHALFHLERPSVTLVVRGQLEPWARPQYTLVRPHVALAQVELGADARVRLLQRSLMVTRKLDRAQAARILIDRVAQLDFPRLFMVLYQSHELLQEDNAWEQFMDAAHAKHGERANHLESMVQGARNTSSVIATRNSVTDPELRFFLALLLNVPCRRSMHTLINERFPDQDPNALCCRWLAELGDQQSAVSAFQQLAEEARLGRYRLTARLGKALPFPASDPKTEPFLRALLEGLDVEQTLDRLTGEFGAGQFDASVVRAAHVKLKGLPELASLVNLAS